MLIEELDLEQSWLRVTNKIDLAWQIKTGQKLLVPLLPAVVNVLRKVIGKRRTGPLFLRLQFKPAEPDQDIPSMKKELATLLRSHQGALTRKAQAEYAKRVRQRTG